MSDQFVKCKDPDCYVCNNYIPEDFFRQGLVTHGPRMGFTTVSDEFKKWFDCIEPDDAYNRKDWLQHAFTAGQASGRAEAEREIVARWPSVEDFQNAYSSRHGDTVQMIYDKLFPNDKRDEVK